MAKKTKKNNVAKKAVKASKPSKTKAAKGKTKPAKPVASKKNSKPAKKAVPSKKAGKAKPVVAKKGNTKKSIVKKIAAKAVKTIKAVVKKAAKPVKKSVPVKSKQIVKPVKLSKAVKPVKTAKAAPPAKKTAPSKPVAKPQVKAAAPSKKAEAPKKTEAKKAESQKVEAKKTEAPKTNGKQAPKIEEKRQEAPPVKAALPARPVRKKRPESRPAPTFNEDGTPMKMTRLNGRNGSHPEPTRVISAPVVAPKPVIVQAEKKKEPKGKFEMEYVVHASPELIFDFITSPSGLSEWFADDVNIRQGVYTFFWDGAEQEAKLIGYKEPRMARFQWTDRNDGSYFEFRIEVDELTRDVSLIITDFAEDPMEQHTSKLLWDSQVNKLLHVIGAYS